MGMTQEQKELVISLKQKVDLGQRVDAQVLTKLYNDITGKNVKPTTCGSCLRKQLFELVKILDSELTMVVPLSEEDKQFLLWTQTLEEGHFPSFGKVVDIYNKTFGAHRVESNCLKCLKEMLSQLYECIE